MRYLASVKTMLLYKNSRVTTRVEMLCESCVLK
jgi:hypothetical protein